MASAVTTVRLLLSANAELSVSKGSLHVHAVMCMLMHIVIVNVVCTFCCCSGA